MSVRRISPVVIWKRKKEFRFFFIYLAFFAVFMLLAFAWILLSMVETMHCNGDWWCWWGLQPSSSKSPYSIFISLHLHLHHQRYNFQRLEAMVWALDRINLSPNLLPNITLGNKKFNIVILVWLMVHKLWKVFRGWTFVKYWGIEK